MSGSISKNCCCCTPGLNTAEQSIRFFPKPLTIVCIVKIGRHFFVNVPSWFDWMAKQDFVIGGRLHGNVAGVLNGCAPLFIAQDARMRELLQYHQFPIIPAQEIKSTDDFADLAARSGSRFSSSLPCAKLRSFCGFPGKEWSGNGVFRTAGPAPKLRSIKRWRP